MFADRKRLRFFSGFLLLCNLLLIVANLSGFESLMSVEWKYFCLGMISTLWAIALSVLLVDLWKTHKRGWYVVLGEDVVVYAERARLFWKKHFIVPQKAPDETLDIFLTKEPFPKTMTSHLPLILQRLQKTLPPEKFRIQL